MKSKILLLALSGFVLLGTTFAQAQPSKFLVTFRGTCVSNNPAGVFVTRPITQVSWLQEFAKSSGMSLKSLAVVYHFNADTRGDTIEIINATNGAVLATPFLLFFGQDASLDRTALTNGVGNQVKIIQYVYTPQSGHSLGDALLTEYFLPNRPAYLPSVIVTGPMNYLVKPDGGHNLEICSGTLVTGRAVQFAAPSSP